MPRLPAYLSMLYPELPRAERFAAAAADGFDAVEFQFPHDTMPAVALAERAAAHGLEVVLVNAPPGGVREHSFHPVHHELTRALAHRR